MAVEHVIQLKLRHGVAPNQIAGRLVDERGEQHPFSSWLGLLSVIEACRDRSEYVAGVREVHQEPADDPDLT